MWYNYAVKRLAFITTALFLSAALGFGVFASAQTAETKYPENGDFVFRLSFSSLKDYAVGDNSFAFVDGNSVKIYEIESPDESGEATVYKNGSLTEYGDFDVTVTSVDYQNGSFYYADGNSAVYSLPDKTTAVGVTLSAAKNDLSYKGYTYVLLENCIRIINIYAEESAAMTVEIAGGFSCLKQYGESVYAVKDNRLCKFTAAEMQTPEMQYVDFSPAQTVSVGNVAQALKDYALKFATVKQGAFMTEVDLSKPLSGCFEAGETKEADEDINALLLGYSGNAAIVSVGKKSFITLKVNVAEEDGTERYFTQAEFTKAQLLGNAIYVSPYVMECVYACYPATGAIVKVTGKIQNDALESDFYEVEYTYENNGQPVTVKGYVIAGLLTGDNVNDNLDPAERPDGNYSEKNDVRAVLLVLMVVVLVLIAISYLAWVGTSGKRKKSKSKTPPDA